ncbi:MAG: hypothetical protein COA76_00400 [Moritella sp.]|uniref:hypothetical protein n=1 Tax=Moritella sp. PE36 TaxID=58051 RepID=UPI0001568F11|nr:hypothetical protein [Moritella sp. PE36]EDM65627.1 hypothetical protein PE36_13409 [Moritella sp. PE36]PHR90165.1 MAG: hypothetical protein COA76_00400 [Moritella sp.]
MLRKNKIALGIVLLSALLTTSTNANVMRDSQGLEIIIGPVGEGYYENVHIISSTVGVISSGESIIVNSVIEAPICVRATGINLTIRGSNLYCDLCVQFTGRALINNKFMNNKCEGQFTNRPDVFGM